MVQTELHHDVSRPLRELAKLTGQAEPKGGRDDEEEGIRLIPLPPGLKSLEAPDTTLQSRAPMPATAIRPLVIKNFEGLGEGQPGFAIVGAPPDTNGAVGLTQYVQWVNTSFAIFDKATGNLVQGPTLGNALWRGFGGECESQNNGDPIVSYDKLADRWVLTQLAIFSVAAPGAQCIAVSTSSDATGTYNRYSFRYDALNDYPKLGVWPDAYYITFNMFGPDSFLGPKACAYDRSAMLSGQAATEVCFQKDASKDIFIGGLLPSDVDGLTPPPVGSPNFLLGFGSNSLTLFKFHVDFATPFNSTLTGPTNIPVAPFTPLCAGRTCVPQPNTGTTLDGLDDRLMYRLAYRNFGDHESLVANHSVAAGSSGGVRWYELRDPNGTATIAQQGTFAPDDSYRWMGSVAMDASGDLAVGYSISGVDVFPSIAITGRTPMDPAGVLQDEISIVNGQGSQTNSLTRWGDYSAMQVDPSDDCTFWYTTEYLQSTGSFNWRTRIASFKFPGCRQSDFTLAGTHTGDFTQGQTGATYSLTVTNSGGKDSSGTVTVNDTLPAGLSATSAAGTGWSCTLAPVSCTRSDVLAAYTSYPVITLTVNVASDAPGAGINNAVVSGGGEQNTGNDTSSDATTIIQLGPDLAIVGVHTGTFIQGQSGVYTLTVSNVGLTPTDNSLITVADTLPAGFILASVTGAGWSCNGATAVCSRSDILGKNASYPVIRITVNVPVQTPATVTNTATVSGGGDSNSLNNISADSTKVVSPPPDLTITKTHSDNFLQGQIFAPYTLTVSNVGSSASQGSVIVTDMLPTGLGVSPVIISGLGWTCNLANLTCTRNDALAAGASYPNILLMVDVAEDASAAIINTVKVSGGGEINTDNDTATDPTTIDPGPELTVELSHIGDFTVGQTGAYMIKVGNKGKRPTAGLVTLIDILPFGFTATTASGDGWSCGQQDPIVLTLKCTRSDTLAVGATYPLLTVSVRVDGRASANVINTAQVSGGGDLSFRIGRDPTRINVPDLTFLQPVTRGLFTGSTSATYVMTVSNVGAIATAGGTVSVEDFLPTGVTAIAVAGDGWMCSSISVIPLLCSRPAGVLARGGSYPPLTFTLKVAPDASRFLLNYSYVYGIGDANPGNNFVPDTLTISPFGIVPGSTSDVTVNAGGTASFPFTVALSTNSSNPPGALSFSASGLPPNSTATFTPTSATQTGSITMSVKTSGSSTMASSSGLGSPRTGFLASMLFLFGLLVAGRRRGKRGRTRWLSLGGGIFGALLFIFFTGCGGGSKTQAPTTPISPPGTYAITVTATSSVKSLSTASFTVNLTVQ